VPRAERQALRFVRALLPGGSAGRAEGGGFVTADGVALAEPAVRRLLAEGVLAGNGKACRANKETRGWVRRQMLGTDFAAQHRLPGHHAEGAPLNLAESPLARLAAARDGVPFLERHHIEAGERVRRLVERAQLQPRLTMSYSGAHTASTKGQGHAADITELAAEARRALADIHRILPRDCAGVVLDVCGLLKGLQTVESERGWPRRSAKLVLRIGLEQLALHFGMAAQAVGPASRRPRAWQGPDARPGRFD
jgi:hypothetical protein